MKANLSLLIPVLLVLTACSSRGVFDFNAIGGAYYVGAEHRYYEGAPDIAPNHVWFGPYRIRKLSEGLGGLTEFYDKGNLPGESLSAWWVVPYKNKSDQYFYARTLPDHGIQAPARYFWSDWSYFAYISFGPAYISDDAVPSNTTKDLKLVRVSKWSGAKYYALGKESSLYYSVIKQNINALLEPLDWIEVPGIAITQSQFELLQQRCGKPWLKTRCFMDLSFPDLTPEQKAYINAHEHEDDQYWLSDAAKPPKVEEKINYWL